MREFKDIQIKVTNASGYTIEITLPWDASIMGQDGSVCDEWLGAFRTILFWEGFREKAIEEYLPTTEEVVEGG